LDLPAELSKRLPVLGHSAQYLHVRTESLLTSVSISGKRDSEARDEGAELASRHQLSIRRDSALARIPAKSGRVAQRREISVTRRVRGGGRSRCLTALRAKIPAKWEISGNFFAFSPPPGRVLVYSLAISDACAQFFSARDREFICSYRKFRSHSGICVARA
jgi:hypothetical protein